MAYNLERTSVNLEMEDERQQPASYYPTSETYSRIEGGNISKRQPFSLPYQTRLSKISQPHRQGFHGVVVSTLDFESSDLDSTPGGTLNFSGLQKSLLSFCRLADILKPGRQKTLVLSKTVRSVHQFLRLNQTPAASFYSFIRSS
nr:hypothetical protein MTR_8g094750 [Ipomoea trifida]